jgi:membrane-bound metal-dependent hydrolase YbcI (DUF457 family)
MLAWILARGFFSRRGRDVTVGMILAGTLADVDGISAWFGPRAYLIWHRTYTHSLVGTLLVVIIGTFVALRLDGKKTDDKAESSRDWNSTGGIVFATAVAAIAHLLMELCQSEGVTLLWPLTSRRFAADLLPGIDPWILALLILGMLVPELFRLVSTEIGEKSKIPRGRNGARVAAALLIIYVGARYLLHTSAMAELDAHAYKTESPRKVGAFADALSIFNWHGVVETQSMMCTVEAVVGPGRPFDPESAYCQHKPEESTALELAQKTEAAQEFLRVARFPKATVEKNQDGYEILIRGVQNEGESELRQRVAARILLNDMPRVIEDELIWGKEHERR